MNVVYFVAGFLTCFIGLLSIAADQGNKRRTKEKKQDKDRAAWASITSIHWDFDFPISFDHEQKAVEVGHGITQAMVGTLAKPRVRDITVAPGRYDVRIGVAAHFTKRD